LEREFGPYGKKGFPVAEQLCFSFISGREELLKRIDAALRRMKQKGYRHHPSYFRLKQKRDLIASGMPYRVRNVLPEFLVAVAVGICGTQPLTTGCQVATRWSKGEVRPKTVRGIVSRIQKESPDFLEEISGKMG